MMFKNGDDLVMCVGIFCATILILSIVFCIYFDEQKKDEHQVIHATYATIIVEHVPNYDGITTNMLKPIELPRLKIKEER